MTQKDDKNSVSEQKSVCGDLLYSYIRTYSGSNLSSTGENRLVLVRQAT